MKKFLIITSFLFLAGGMVLSGPVLAENHEDVVDDADLVQSLLEQVELLMAQIQELQAQVEIMREAQEAAGEEVEALREEVGELLKLNRQLQEGMSGEDVELLQEILATDPDIYPEGLVTGFFGPLTKGAVMKFQEKVGLEQVGRVGPQTLSRINQLLEEGAGDSGVVPPGLLRAPGLQGLLDEDEEFSPGPPTGFTPPGLGGVPPGQVDDDEEVEEENGDENGDEEGNENGENEDSENGDEEENGEEEGGEEENDEEEGNDNDEEENGDDEDNEEE